MMSLKKASLALLAAVLMAAVVGAMPQPDTLLARKAGGPPQEYFGPVR